ncbi:protein of unknown function [Devosia crocina]|uniref:Uncharacterized protein n=1 Tax=Devosia crocina TaxID=429728 RepID=A0A1I7NUQ2_9HYPH|nr:heme-binding beta-barrel domain-containing protein [Devosia crocina]SFV38396.1 protein of unknown function [Devosia crocina]
MAKNIGKAVAVAVTMLGLGGAAPASAGPTEQALLANYIGNWRGESVLQGGDSPEPFRCRLSVSSGNQGKINYTGRCALINMNLSVSGTIAFVEARGHYEAVMTSNAGFSGTAVGQQRGNQIGFDLVERQRDRGGNDVQIGSRLFLIGDQITVEFQVEFNNSGELLTASVPFSR